MQNNPEDYLNRELSWLEFNQRVLDEALDETIPLLERLKFLAITASNLDEFFMVRVGGLQLLVEQGKTNKDASGSTPRQQLELIGYRARQMVDDQYACFLETIEPALAQFGIKRVTRQELPKKNRTALHEFFLDEICSVLSPVAIDDNQPFPSLTNQTLCICFRIKVDTGSQATLTNAPFEEATERFAIISLGHVLSRFLTIPSEGKYDYVLLEDFVAHFADHFFPNQQILESVAFRITRNADMSVSEDNAYDLLAGIERVLDERKESGCVRLEIDADTSDTMLEFMKCGLGIDDSHVYKSAGPLDLSAFMRLTSLHGGDELRYSDWNAQRPPDLNTRESMFDTIARRDILLYHPYESFEPLVRLLSEAASDPNVLAIKQTLYRTSRDSKIVQALIDAATNGKHVTALLELKARFDEARNIEWARHLEQAGAQVIYGVRDLKTHAKACVVVRRERNGIARYVHFGTGNYNESTAHLYSDVSYFTCNEELGSEAINFFNAITGYSRPLPFHKIAVAPLSLREKLLEMIEVESQRSHQGQTALIDAKMNSLVDPEIIAALYRASQNGVRIRLNVRGICCLRPGVPGLSENIEVISIIDRFLEHARVMHFYHGGDRRVFISSADWMPRNLNRRVELLVPVEDPRCRDRLIRILDIHFSDNVKASCLNSDGSYTRRSSSDADGRIRSQEELYRLSCEAARIADQSKTTEFEPYRNPEHEGG